MRAFFGTAEAVPVQNRFRPVPDSQVSTGSGSQVSTGPDPRRSMAMKRVRYTKFTGDLSSEMSMEDLLKALSDYLLDSGFQNPWAEFQDLDQTLDDLRAEGRLEEPIDKLIDRLERENYISTDRPQQANDPSQGPGQMGDAQ